MEVESPFKKQKIDIKYLWRNIGCQKTQNLYYYENENGELIWGNLVGGDNNPYNESSIYRDGAVRIGIAYKYVKSVNQCDFNLLKFKPNKKQRI
jgi:hypothetical protein